MYTVFRERSGLESRQVENAIGNKRRAITYLYLTLQIIQKRAAAEAKGNLEKDFWGSM